MEKLLMHYQIELALLRHYGHGFNQRFPGLADQLLMGENECKDPQVERLIQSTALMAARISKRLDDDYPLFTESLLEMLYPHYLRPLPSCSIIVLDLPKSATPLPAQPQTIRRGALLKSTAVRGVSCLFRTTSDIVIAPVSVAGVRFDSHITAPAGIRLPMDATSRLSIAIDGVGTAAIDAMGLTSRRLFINGDPMLCAAVRDALFTRAGAAYVSFAGDDAWRPLRHVPVAAVGFAEDQALIPFPARSQPAYRLLTEYFAFPDKFNFIDLDWTEISRSMPPGCRSCTLHLALENMHGASAMARALGKISAQNLLLHCAPVVNLFARPSAPVSIRHTAPDYALLADAACPAAYEIYGIESATLITDVARQDGVEAVLPFYSMRHGDPAAAGRYWVMRRDDVVAELSPGHEMRIALVDTELTPVDLSTQTLSVELLCSNRDLPTALSYGQPEGDLTMDGLSHHAPVRLLRKPSPPYRFASGNGAHWRLIAHLSLNHRDLSSFGLDELRKTLTLYDLPRSAISQRQIRGMVSLDYKVLMAWIPGKPSAALMPGIEIRLALDEDAFIGSSIVLFSQILDHFFGLHAQINVFTQLLAVSSRTGEELMRCPRRSGETLLE
ncbi:type VI secretion system baseplate subunit TssF [Rugamonas sp.]|uniref:type VI secretion system baseplate subunit TssF n=1 Tax=Rugamonas sp. TaxID=1926287 RepID=UPI0025F5E340|nr:type VI secretion system baseplate subunit TssF [Rugamonas sp.]